MAPALRALELATRPVHPESAAALDRRWSELPARVRTRAQVLGRRMTGCEGTHGVFPRCNLACTPCYHSREANRVRVDGAHTVAEVDRQMAYLRRLRGPGQHAQLIGGEVTLLGPEDHARALAMMHRHDRVPMSMSHGDFDYEYLERLALDEEGRPRFRRLAFAGHFDSLMLGRRGIERPTEESDLHPFRQRFCDMFGRLRREHRVRSVLAHNMTVTPGNLGQVAEVARACSRMGFRLLSFQPAAFLGNPSRWRDDYRALSSDDVWAEIERGLGTRLPHRLVQVGDERCNRTAYGLLVGDRWVAVADERVPADHEARDAFMRVFGGVDLTGRRTVVTVRVLRTLVRHAATLPVGIRWALRFARRAGTLRLLRHGAHPLTLVVHSFMDAETVRPAWEALQRGERSKDPAVRASQERLEACSYAMAHPDSDMLVPACVQHAVLDAEANVRLARRLPRSAPTRA
ncbi:MAG TPA: radical SAM protein [Thermoleophilaceae bacterium]|nr:radical SAM protein [Thermoleophilaceae bacterium]